MLTRGLQEINATALVTRLASELIVWDKCASVHVASTLGSEATGVIHCPESLFAHAAPTYGNRSKRELNKMYTLPFFTIVLRKHTYANAERGWIHSLSRDPGSRMCRFSDVPIVH